MKNTQKFQKKAEKEKEKTKNGWNKQKTNCKMVDLNPTDQSSH